MKRKQIGAACSMPYTVTSDTLGLAIGPVAETADDMHEALSKARQMYETGLVNVSMKESKLLIEMVGAVGVEPTTSPV